MVECVFQKKKNNVRIYTIDKKKAEDDVKRKGIEKKARKERNTSAIVIERGTRAYKDTLKDVKDRLQNANAEKTIKSFRSTKEGDLLVVMEDGGNAVDEARKAIKESRGVNTQLAGQRERMETLHLRNLDELVTKEEVEEALERIFGSMTIKGCKLSEPRPARNNTMPMTLTIGRTTAQEILKK
ncbi:hypothetical protein HHI36_009420 [Cryptolaemus montrouzieri]|uniref:Uncharacterized protein n=1 Tax=Cryptolaemus montrouzieri TaxID=559131 RepID=A0ABD2MV79_9CUCU